MNIITLTTDFGLQDYYTAALKGSILTQNRDLLLVDVSHTVRNHDIVGAAFTLKNTWRNFPEQSIHVVSVNNGGGALQFIAFEYQNHYFVGPDNGVFTLLIENLPHYIRQNGARILPFDGVNFHQIKNIITNAVAHLTHEESSLDTLGQPTNEILQRIHLQPVITASEIRGAIIHIDNYDNAILNISRETFERVGRGRKFQLYFKRFDPITKLSESYNEVAMGETLCLFNSDFLEISINLGKAAELLGLKIDDTVQIEFQD